MINAKQELRALQHRWSNCEKCELGLRRAAQNAAIVPGEGHVGSIMLIGEGPGQEEEQEERPFVGQTGELLRAIFAGYHFNRFYLTNIVCCRACAPLLDDSGSPRFRKGSKGIPIPIFRDQIPSPPQMSACAARLYEEIYLVDPLIILALGATVSEFLLNRKVALTKERGKAATCTIPGRTQRAVLTEKKKVWERTVKGEIVRPMEPSRVKYTVIPTLHPAYVLRKLSDHGADSPWNLLAGDIKKAIQVLDFLQDNTDIEEREFDHGEETEN